MNYLYIITQLISITFVRFFFPIFSKLTILGKEHLKNINEPVIFIANHNSRLDPVYMTVFLPNHLYKKMMPFRYMTLGKTMRKPRSIPGLYLIGCFPIEPGTAPLDIVLKKTMKILKKGDNAMVMFPEARMHKVGAPPYARPGIAYLAKQTERLIIPVGLSGMREMGWKSFWTRNSKVTMTFGKPFYYQDIVTRDEDLRDTAKSMMKRVYNLL